MIEVSKTNSFGQYYNAEEFDMHCRLQLTNKNMEYILR